VRARRRSASFAPSVEYFSLVHLAARLVKGGYSLLDTQFETPHLRQFGVVEIRREDYRSRLQAAVRANAQFPSALTEAELEDFLQSITQTS